jgi:large subunit ribosomal protein L22
MVNYSFQNYNPETMARSSASNLSISLKKTVEIMHEIQGKKVSYVIAYLGNVTKLKLAVPYKRFKKEMPHRKGMAAGGFPVNAATDILKLVKSAEKNAQERGITGELRVLSASARKGIARYHPGRYQGRKMKATHVEIIVGVKAQ